MTTLRQQLRRLAAIAFLAIFGIAFAPTVSHTLAAAGPGNPWAEICSVASGTAPGEGQSPTHLDHCPLCGLAAGALPMPVAAKAWSIDAGAAPLPPLFLHAASTLHAWASAQPRAPPTTG